MLSIGILGGMGPLATVRLFEEIVLNTSARCDQEHLRVLVDDNPRIPDRTAYLLGQGPSPEAEIVRMAQGLLDRGADLLVMACNTAHFFAPAVVAIAGDRFIDMVEETAKSVRRTHPDRKEFVLMATLGTYVGKVYEDVFARYGLRVLQPDDREKQVVMERIHAVKAGDFAPPDDYRRILADYQTKGKDAFLLGCTELSVLNHRFDLPGLQVDPLRILAREAIRRAGGTTVDPEKGERPCANS